jgi:ABC-2 type transport system permease protein
MPARVALTDVPIWEQLLSAALLVAAAMFVRWAAGRIVAVAMLMYGKEATWTEVRRWVRQG